MILHFSAKFKVCNVMLADFTIGGWGPWMGGEIFALTPRRYKTQKSMSVTFLVVLAILRIRVPLFQNCGSFFKD